VIRSKSKGRTLPAVNLWAVPTKRVDGLLGSPAPHWPHAGPRFYRFRRHLGTGLRVSHDHDAGSKCNSPPSLGGRPRARRCSLEPTAATRPTKIEPVGVCAANDRGCVTTAIAIARESGVPVLSRAAGASQCGQTVKRALVLDYSKYLRNVREIDPDRRVAGEPDARSGLSAQCGPRSGPDFQTQIAEYRRRVSTS
jgi:hypothetical protein